MPFRSRLLASRMPRYAVGATVLGVLLSLSAGTVQALPAKPEPARPPGVQDSPDPAQGKNAKPRPRPVDEAAKAAVGRLDAAVLPRRGSTEVEVEGEGTKPVKVGGLPVTVTEVPTAAARMARGDKPRARPAAAPSKVQLDVLGQDRADEAGAGALLRIRPGDGTTDASKVRVSVNYSAFEEAYGGSYGARLRLVELPACAATHDLGSKNCRGKPKIIESINDTDAETVTADVTLAIRDTTVPAQAQANTAGSTVLALQAGDSSDKGDYKATPLAPSASWNVSNSSGGFSWDYPLRTVPTPGGLTPSIGLGYSSQSADGRTAATNNQGSWLGDGFAYEPGYIERSYKPCSEDGHKTSAEQCWAFDNATVMLNGSASQLIKDDESGAWHFSSESGAKVEQLTGAENGDNNGEHWKITTTEGTEYYFGLNRLPGWSAGKEITHSTWTTPVFGDDAGEPCYNSTFAEAHCKQAWRWNLDHVKDTHGNVMSYYYEAETNHYALNGKTDVKGTAYDRGGYLSRIDYGQRDGAVYDAKAPARVAFRTAERCLPTADFDCAPSKMTKANAAHWPDTPVDRFCKADTKCDASQSSATFWTTKRLTGITTQMRTGADSYADVDAWTLTHQFTDNGDDTKTLWLTKIDHEGKVGGSSKLPSLELQGAHLVNRVDSDDDNIDAFHRLRLVSVLSETGAQLDVTYAPAECTATALPKPGESAKRCYPVVWSPPGSIEPRTDWFHKYVVQEIRESDRTGGGDDLVTRYDYQGNAGWRHAEPDGITDAKYLTWSQWQGYGRTTVTSGNGEEISTRVDYTHLQGLNGDKLPGGGTRTETVQDSTGTSYTGHKEYTGFEIESKAYDRATGGKIIAKTISEPWKHDTATQTRSWATTKATAVQKKTSRGYSLQSDGTWQETKSVSHYDTGSPNVRLARTDDFGDLATTEDDSCTRLWYADNPSRNIYELPSRSEAVAVGCTATPDRNTQVITDERTSYDNGAFNAAPTRGDATRTERLTEHDGTSATYQTTGTTEYDRFGRPTAQTDAGDAKTTIAYTDANGLISRSESTNALGHVTTTDYAPAWGQASGQSDPNGKRTDFAHDPLGRLTKVWLPDRSKSTNPSIKYTYLVRRDKPVAVKTEKIENDATSYGIEYQLYDALLRPRQMQTEGPDGTRMVADVFYDGTGNPRKTNATYNATGAPSSDLLLVANGEVGAQTVSEYDGLGRTTALISQVAGVEQWRTTTTYDGERTHVNPPSGGVPTTAISDAHGNTTELRHYNGPDMGPSAGYDTTRYTYDRIGRMQTVTDSRGNSWRFEFDQLGRATKSVDPDAGTTETAYDGLDRPVAVTDGRGEKTSTVYDKLNRPLTTWRGEPDTGTKLTETRYDKAGWLGHAYMSLRYTDGTEYFGTAVQSMDAFYQPLKTAYSVPQSEGALAGVYTFTTTYNGDSTVSGIGMPAAGGLASESIAFGYDALQRPTSMAGKTPYVTGTVYSSTSQLKQLQLSTGTGKRTWQSFFHEKGTDRLTRSTTDVEGEVGQLAAVKRSHYSYDQAGNILSLSDTAGAAPDVQCFDYDGRQRLTEAWTPAATEAQATGSGTVGAQLNGATPQACSATPGSSPLGGPAAYWASYTVDAIGNRTQDVTHDTGLDTAKDITRDYAYGEGAAGPHAVTKVTENTPTGDRQSTYAYDATGNTTQRTLGGDTQTLDWNSEGKLTRTTEADGKETTYLYDAGGNRVIRRDAAATTVYLPGMELNLAKGTSTVKATRYYAFGGETIAVREDSGNLSFLASDHQGTSSLAINAVTGAVAQRRFDPYGGARGEPSGTWPGEKGFVGGTLDQQSGLIHVGARQYDPGLGKFLSADPLIDYTNPQQMSGYAYADNSPVTYSDPSGLAIPECMTGEIACQGGIPISKKKNPRPEVDRAKKEEQRAYNNVAAAQTNLNTSKQQVKQVAKTLIKIIKREIGIDAALDCFSSGDIGACGETLLNVAGSFAGGLAGKILVKYGRSWSKVKEGWDLAKRVTGLAGDLIKGVKGWFKNSKALGKARDKLSDARTKTKAVIAKYKKCHSFLPGTRVLLADGTTKPIEDIAIGDKVAVTDPETGRTTTREVVGTIVTEDDKNFVDLTIATDKANAAALISTTTHPFWVKSESKWIKAGDLKSGMTLRTSNGDTATVEHVRHFDQRQRTHDLTINDIHTYYVVAGATPVLVHNCNKNQGVYIFDDKSKPGHVYIGKTYNFNVRLDKHADLGRRNKDGPVICIHVCGDDTALRIREHIMKVQFGKMGFKLSSGIEGFGRNLYNKRQATQPELPFE